MLKRGQRTGISYSRWMNTVKIPKSFDLDLVTERYEENTRNACNVPHNDSSPPFRLVLPPPNVTGRLHIGHALTVTVEDVIARQNRLNGVQTEWLPGFDHAGIATQSVVERELWKREGKTRHDMKREQFVQKCKQWAQENSSVIREQLSRMGATLDWNKQYYTLDERFSSAVTRAFVQLDSEGLIFRDKRFVNWSPSLRSSISDQEVDTVEVPSGGKVTIPSPEGKGKRDVIMGVMHCIKYQIVDGGRNGVPLYITVGTTRPETIWADIALAIHPSHKLTSKLQGKRVVNPLDARILPIIVDDAVMIDKGSGILKITPAHDRLDAEIAARHWEEIEEVIKDARTRSCIDECGLICGGTPIDGMDRFDARTKVLCDLKSSNSLEDPFPSTKSSTFSVCSRTGDIIEPRVSLQWFLDCSQLHYEALKALNDGRLQIVPSTQANRLVEWFSHSGPWCLSRQLQWGHRIPAWKRKGETKEEWIMALNEEEARRILSTHDVQQDEDVLDTWFSSALVPLVVSGWMEGRTEWNSPPISILETGTDILEFWVASMVALTMRLSGGQLPFPVVMLHGLVKDAEGRKMSKSLGNVVDPLDVLDGISLQKMEERLNESSLCDKEKVTALSSLRSRFPKGIDRCGADALRFALLRHDVLSGEVPIDIAQLSAEGLKFCNKLWNIVAYYVEVRSKVEGHEAIEGSSFMDEWIRSRLSSSLVSADNHIQSHRPHLAFSSIQQFILLNLADVYIESTKRALWDNDMDRLLQVHSTLRDVLQLTFRQLSVFLPFVSDFLFERVAGKDVYAENLKVEPSWICPSLESSIDLLLSAVSAARLMKEKLVVPQKTEFEGVLHSSLPSSSLLPLSSLLSLLVNINITAILPLSSPSPPQFESITVPGFDAILALKVEEKHGMAKGELLKEKLRKELEREKEFQRKAEHYDKVAMEERSRGVKRERAAITNEKKAQKARNVAQSARQEAEKITNLLESSR